MKCTYIARANRRLCTCDKTIFSEHALAKKIISKKFFLCAGERAPACPPPADIFTSGRFISIMTLNKQFLKSADLVIAPFRSNFPHVLTLDGFLKPPTAHFSCAIRVWVGPGRAKPGPGTMPTLFSPSSTSSSSSPSSPSSSSSSSPAMAPEPA